MVGKVVVTQPGLMALFFFFNDTATTEIYTLSLHDALPISPDGRTAQHRKKGGLHGIEHRIGTTDRKSTRLNSSHLVISYAVFCLKKKNSVTLSRGARVGFMSQVAVSR